MCHSKSAVAYAAADANQGHIGTGIGNVYFYLLIASCGKKAGGRGCKDFFSAGSQTSGYRNKILLCNTKLNKLPGKCLGKWGKRGRASGIRAYHNNRLVIFRSFHKSFTNCLAVCYVVHESTSSNSLTAV